MTDIIKPYLTLDLRGVPCPLNFVKVKIQLDKMEPGQTLEVWLDSGEPIESVTQSILEEGHKILLKQETNNHFKILIAKHVS